MRNLTILRQAKRSGLVPAICIGLLFVSASIHAAPPQADAPLGDDAAEQAYVEVAAKNYTAAIQHFRNALAQNPSNAIWRTDLGFACLAAGLPEDAEAQFAMVYSDHPEDLAVALQLGYLAQQFHRDEDARKYFEQAARSTDTELSVPAQKALADMQDAQRDDRRQKGYELIAQSKNAEALTVFESIHSDDPADASVALQLGYLYQAAQRLPEAREMFAAAAGNADPELSVPAQKALAELEDVRLSDQRQRGYELIAEHRNNEAITAFEVIHRADPSDGNMTLQLGYLYQAAQRLADARAMFAAAAKDADPKIVALANAGLAEVQNNTKLWFASIYAAPFYESRFSNEINPVNEKVGLSPSRYFQPYIGLWFNRDIRSQAGTLPQIYSDNSAVIAVGIQSTLAKTGIVLYAQAGTAINLVDERPLAASDYRVGAVWSRTWGTPLFAPESNDHSSPEGSAHSISWTGSAYADVGYYSRYGRNVIGELQLREGINLPTARAVPMQLLAATNLLRDSHGNFYNNVVEVGPILRIAPLRHVSSLFLEAQYVCGFYDVHDPANPYGPRYSDFRILLIYSKTF
jgi:Flp pilus assembly protein TadD